MSTTTRARSARPRAARAALLTLAALLAFPAASPAHGRSGAVASDWHARVTAVEPPLSGLEWQVLGGDVRLQLTVPAGHELRVPGDGGEPFLRFANGEVAV